MAKPFKPINFGRYLLNERIAVGGMAEIFAGKIFGAMGFEKQVVIKRILPQFGDDAEFLRMFVTEAKLVCHLEHPNIVQVHELGEIDAQYYIAMEYVNGIDGRQMWRTLAKRKQRLPGVLALFVVAEFLKGLDYAHRAVGPDNKLLGVVHRDVSPSNILISYRGDVKIGDFGIALVQQESKTQAGVLKGKYGYMSPEQVAGLKVDHRSDIFAAGIVLAELLLGRRLFLGRSDFETLDKVMNVRLDVLEQHEKALPPEVVRIVRLALQRDPSDRYQSAREFHDDILEFLYERRERVTNETLAAFIAQHVRPYLAKRSASSSSVVDSSSQNAPPVAQSPVLPKGIVPRDLEVTPPPQMVEGVPGKKKVAAEREPPPDRGPMMAAPTSQDDYSAGEELPIEGDSAGGIAFEVDDGAGDSGGVVIEPDSAPGHAGQDGGGVVFELDAGPMANAVPAGGRSADVGLATPPLGDDAGGVYTGEAHDGVGMDLDEGMDLGDGELDLGGDEEAAPPIVHEARPVEPLWDNKVDENYQFGAIPQYEMETPASHTGELDLDNVSDGDLYPPDVVPPGEKDGGAGLELDLTDEDEFYQIPPITTPEAAAEAAADDLDANPPSQMMSAQLRSAQDAETVDKPDFRGKLTNRTATKVLFRFAVVNEDGLLTLTGPEPEGDHADLLSWLHELQARLVGRNGRDSTSQRTCEIHLQQGQPHVVAADRSEEALIAYLLRSGVLEKPGVEKAVRANPHRSLVAAMLAAGLLAPLQITRHVTGFVLENVIDSFAWRDGSFAFYRGRNCSNEGFPTGLDALGMIQKGVAAMPRVALDAYFAPIAGQRIGPNPTPPTLIEDFPDDPLLLEVYRTIGSEQRISETIMNCKQHGDEDDIRRAMYKLIECEMATLS